MTGFGEGKAENDRFEVTVTLRSVNHRFLDLSVRMPEEFRSLEPALVQRLRDALARGRVEVRLSIRFRGRKETRVEIDETVAESYKQAAARLTDGDAVGARLSGGDLLRLPGVVSVEAAEDVFSEDDQELVEAAVTEALSALTAARAREGEELKAVLQRAVGGLGDVVARLTELIDSVRQELHERLRARLAELAGPGRVEEERMAQEAALLADRADIQEEIDRLGLHAEHFSSLLDSDGAIGKRLDFLAQEILRELNTVGSKSRSSEVTGLVLDGKVLCEQLREQVQNVE
ncbi:MAG: YicC/YloC family endoribonuclease [Thermoanaerobaculia bacterium]